MKNLLVLAAICSMSLFAQDKVKVTTGLENILNSEVVNVGTCQNNSLEVLSNISSYINGSYTSITVEASLLLTLNEEVEIYDLKKTKTDGQKSQEKINVKIVQRNNVSKKKIFSRYVSTSTVNGEDKDVGLLIAEVTTLALHLNQECEQARRSYQEIIRK